MRMDPRLLRVLFPSFPIRRAVYRLNQVIHMDRLRIRAHTEERPLGIEIHTKHPRRFTPPPILPHTLGIRQRKDANDRPLVGRGRQCGPLRIDRERCNGGFVRLDHVDGGEGDGIEYHDGADGGGGCCCRRRGGGQWGCRGRRWCRVGEEGVVV